MEGAPSASAPGAGLVLAPTSIGDLIDRITILEIKAARIADPVKAANVARELRALSDIRDRAGLNVPAMAPFAAELSAINATLWDIEDDIRLLDRKGDFGERFVALARGVYTWNDKRAAVKKKINDAFGSAIAEEKSYA
jgi:hypothetical protein